eukprot:CAMPEP_0176425046 /NCGR_PEP_ID=MMETSP0127-20121128/11180_1 /TAXON_ID=938130 /ORGANISM="Platyophrya macrostoma, Strain WH" /LENGTH=873 /DNA_ID=CAMNT_0017806181 /DNA_START=32 /DNA_END=2653 /DNA_ORIENTATION=+
MISKPEDKKQVQKGKNKKLEEDLSEEDKKLKEDLALLVERLTDPEAQIAKNSLELLKTEVKASTSSITSVPKSLRFLKPHYNQIKEIYEKTGPGDFKKSFAEFLSVLSITMGDVESHQPLKYFLEGTQANYLDWGTEYLLHLSGDIAHEYSQRMEKVLPTDDLISIVNKIVPYLIQHNSEIYAIDLLMEVDKLEDIIPMVNENNMKRIILYLTSTALYSADQYEMEKTLKTAYEISLKLKQYSDALRLAIKLDNNDLIMRVFKECDDQVTLKQLALDLGRTRKTFELNEELTKITWNSHMNDFFIKLCKELDVLDPKHPDQVYKAHLENSKGPSVQIDSSRRNLAHTIVNAFVNAGTGKDALMLSKDAKAQPWIYKVKGDAVASATASLGLIFLWDSDGGASELSEYLDVKDSYGRMGAYMAVGLCNSGISNELDPAKALLQDALTGKDELSKIGAIVGLGMAYAGTAREDFLEILLPIVSDVNYSVEMSALAALSLGLIFVGACHEDTITSIIEILQERTEAQLNMTISRFYAVALGLLFFGMQEACEATLDVVKGITHPIARYIELTVESCAYMGSGNVLKVQKMLHECIEHLEEKDSAFQAVAVLGIALIASSEEIGNEMVGRTLNHLLQYGELTIKRAIPLALALLNISNPKLPVQDLLMKLAHDSDVELSQRAIIALGLIGAGTNNARLADLLRQLASYYQKEDNTMFFIRISQGLLYMGKGLLTLQPYYSDRFLLSKVAASGLVIFAHACLDLQNILLGKYHYLYYFLGISMSSRMFFTVDENLVPLPVSVRVGQAVDTVGQAGQPKKITGFQTHTSPVILAHGQKAEIGTEEYIPVSDCVLENIVILKKNPDYKPEVEKPRKKTSL